VYSDFPNADLQKVFANKIKRVQACIDARRHHFQQLLYVQSDFPNADPQKVFANKIKWVQACINACRHHFQHLLYVHSDFPNAPYKHSRHWVLLFSTVVYMSHWDVSWKDKTSTLPKLMPNTIRQTNTERILTKLGHLSSSIEVQCFHHPSKRACDQVAHLSHVTSRCNAAKDEFCHSALTTRYRYKFTDYRWTQFWKTQCLNALSASELIRHEWNWLVLNL
jgi:hypothetical protein